MFEVRFSRRAERNREALGTEDRERIRVAIEELSHDPPTATHVTTLFHPRERLYRKRVGSLRIVFSVDFDSEVVFIKRPCFATPTATGSTIIPRPHP